MNMFCAAMILDCSGDMRCPEATTFEPELTVLPLSNPTPPPPFNDVVIPGGGPFGLSLKGVKKTEPRPGALDDDELAAAAAVPD